MIREMAFKDLNEIVDMGNKFHADALKIHKLGNSTDDFIRYLAFLVESPIATVLVMEEKGRLVGTIAGIISPWLMDNSDIIVTEQWIWVVEDYRGKGAFNKLVEALISWGKDRGANKLVLVSIGSSTEELVRKFYEKRDFSYLETHFIKEI